MKISYNESISIALLDISDLSEWKEQILNFVQLDVSGKISNIELRVSGT